MQALIKLLVNALALFLVAYFFPGITVASFQTALFVAILLAVINTFIRPLLLLFTLPINILTLGLFTFVVNGGIFYFLGVYVKGFSVSSFTTAMLGSLVLSLLSWIGHKIFLPSSGARDND